MRHLYYNKKQKKFYVFGLGWGIDYAMMYPNLSGNLSITYLGSAYKPRLINISHFKLKEGVVKDTELFMYDANESSVFEIAKLFHLDGEDLWNKVYM